MGDCGVAVGLGVAVGVAVGEAEGLAPGEFGRLGRTGSTVICSLAAGTSTWSVGATAGALLGRLAAGSLPVFRAAPSAAPSPTSATSTAAAAPTSGPRRPR